MESNRYKVLRLYCTGMRKAQIARQLGISRERVNQILFATTGIYNPPLIDYSKIDWQKMDKLRKSLRITEREIAENAGCSRATVTRIFAGEPEYIHGVAVVKVLRSFKKMVSDLSGKQSKLASEVFPEDQ